MCCATGSSLNTGLYCAVPQKSLGHEVNELTSSRLLKLEKENQALLKTVEELRVSADAPTRLTKAEKENQKLIQRVSTPVLHIPAPYTRNYATSRMAIADNGAIINIYPTLKFASVSSTFPFTCQPTLMPTHVPSSCPLQ